ncbi:alpha/beta hydrolase [Azospirillum sp. INR13]|uniref:alpha/beta hydrolase n=1 Tax=Azospirillum sp. INR13 TaxID=2596919 RepID=UPI001891F5FA|nr:alpha/beta hydrolase [Azospirillum sp. INR13]MBF5096513.1 alpha/beta hydrolase [Azospirillum sp. INR13]
MNDHSPSDTDKPIDAVIERVRSVYGRWNRSTTVEQMRQDWDALFGASPVAAEVTAVDVGGVPAEWVHSEAVDADRIVLYFHGGGFQVGSPRSHRELMAHISAAASCRVLGVDYRLAPEHRFPAPLEDATAAYRWLLEAGHRPADIAFAGDSAGGGLALSTLLSLRDAGRPMPAAAVAMSPWTDLTVSGASYETRAAADPIHQRHLVQAMARGYLGPDGNPHNPLISPLFADLHGLPPLLIQVGDRETVLSDATDFADKARNAGVLVDLQVWDGMIHVFQQFPNDLPEARRALAGIGDFLRTHFGSRSIPQQGAGQ